MQLSDHRTEATIRLHSQQPNCNQTVLSALSSHAAVLPVRGAALRGGLTTRHFSGHSLLNGLLFLSASVFQEARVRKTDEQQAAMYFLLPVSGARRSELDWNIGVIEAGVETPQLSPSSRRTSPAPHV